MLASPPSSIRAFIAISLPEGLIRSIRDVQAQLESKIQPGIVRWTSVAHLHLTLKFLGNVAAETLPELIRVLRAATLGICPFALSLEQIGCFPSTRRPRVIWIGIGGELEALTRLQVEIDRATEPFGSHSEEREFRAHLTLGRVRDQKPGRGIIQLGSAIDQSTLPAFEPWPVHDFHLFQSKLSPKGAQYTILETYRLAETGA